MFIVIDGIDGSGKKTQTDLLTARLKKEGFNFALADFPQYGKPSAGPVEQYLNGEYGTVDEVSPYQASVFYAVDRFAAAKTIRQWLNDDKVVLANRYVASNMGHQGGKIQDPIERKNYYLWEENLEYGIFNIPRPDLNIYLHLPAEEAQKLVDKKTKRDYIKNDAKRDIHENNLNHLTNAATTYAEICTLFPNFLRINCFENNELLTPSQIHEKIWIAILPLLPKN